MRRTERSIFKFLGLIVALFGGYYLYMMLSGRDELGQIPGKKDKKPSKPAKEPKSPKGLKVTKSKVNKSTKKTGSQTLREQRIMSLLQRRDSIVMADIRKLFPGLNVRTVRRDMDRMVKKGYVRQKGTTRSTVYVKK